MSAWSLRNPNHHSVSRTRPTLEALERRDLLSASPLPVLMVIANRDFYYQEYGDTRRSIESAGIEVDVAAASLTTAVPHPNSGQGPDGGLVMPDLRVDQADASNYSAIVFVGGWGSSSYQYAFSGTYYNAAYNGSASSEAATNRLINDFIDQDKYVTAICHGVSVLAWARVDGVSPIAGRTVSAYAQTAPMWRENAGTPDTTRWHVEVNGAAMVPSRSVGNPWTAQDDVIVDGRIITAENFDSAARFGEVIADEVWASLPPANHTPEQAVIVGAAFGVRGHEVKLSGTFVDADAADTHTFAWQVHDAAGVLVAQGNSHEQSFVPTSTGVHTATFVVTDAAGASASATQSIDVRAIGLVADADDPTRTNLLIGGTDGSDVLWIFPNGSGGAIGACLNGVWLGAFQPTGRVVVHAGAGDDTVHACGPMTTSMWFEGGDGNDYLKGGAGNDVLLGGAGNDIICGGAGRDVIVGGAGCDWLYGDPTLDRIFADDAGIDITPALVDSWFRV